MPLRFSVTRGDKPYIDHEGLTTQKGQLLTPEQKVELTLQDDIKTYPESFNMSTYFI